MLRRRGILAATGAVVAGIVARQISEPVAAAPIAADYFVASGTATNFNAAGTATYGLDTTLGTFDYGVSGAGKITGVSGSGGTGTSGVGSTIGVYGNSGATGVYGAARTTGVYGQAVGMAANTVAVQGVNQASGANGHGVVGQAKTGYGVLGYTTGGSASLAGISTNINIPAFAGGNNISGGIAAHFSGLVYVDGRLVVTDPSYKSGLLKHPDGSHRLVYCVESPESWIEDFGKGQLTNGRADVKLDPDFAATVQTDDYAVFLTPYGALGALRIGVQRADGFTVEEIAGSSNGAFRYRVVAKPKTDTKSARLAKFEVPTGSALPSVNDLPKPPEAPKDPTPGKPTEPKK